MSDIKPIQTRYKGYNFRSRLEARYAVFFDALGLEWDYEPEGFDLGSGVWYLPDFYLPTLGVYVEIKPNTAQKHKCNEFRDLTGVPILLCCGVPGINRMELYCHDTTDSSGGPNKFECDFSPLYRCDEKEDYVGDRSIKILVYDERQDRVLLDGNYEPLNDNVITMRRCFTYVDSEPLCRYEETIRINDIHLEDAINKARSARFEHGQNGAT